MATVLHVRVLLKAPERAVNEATVCAPASSSAIATAVVTKRLDGHSVPDFQGLLGYEPN